jgi:hypothetical protein
MRPAALLLLLVGSVAAQSWSPEKFWQHESAYAGAAACRPCHADIFKKQEASTHARTLRPLTEVAEFARGVPFQLHDRVGASDLRLTRREAGPVLLTSSRDGEELTIPLNWAFGAGTKAVTPVTMNEQGEYVESRISWFRSTQTFDLTPGARERKPQSFAETLGQKLNADDRRRCFGCHTSRSPSTDPVPARHEMGIRCERCHGPGFEHTRQGPDARASIFHPRALDGFRMAQVCGACHGRPPRDIDFAEIRDIQQRPLSARFPSQRLVLSRCFNETDGGVKCTVCHDPHSDVPQERATMDAACNTCHSAQRQSAAVCPKSTRDCASCHMPKARVLHHTEFADHWIRVIR